MKQTSTWAALAAAAWGLIASAGAQEEAALELWNDPTFQKHFLGSYGVQAEVEPRITAIEREQMEKVMAWMGVEGGMDKALALLQKTTKPASSAVFDFTVANILFQQDRLEGAAEWYRSAIDKFPSFQRAHKNLGLIYARTGSYARAAASLTRSVELGAKDGLTFGLLGYSLLLTEQFTAADGAYRQAMMLQPETVDWKLGLARCLFKQRRYEEAATLCGEMIRAEPGRADLWVLQANAFLGMKQPMRAAENYEYLDLAGKAGSQALNTLGDIYLNDGSMDMAADAYLRGADKDEKMDASRALRNAEALAARGAHEPAGRLVARLKDPKAGALGTEDRKRLLKLETRLCAARGAADAEQVRLLDEIVRLDPLDGEALILLAQRQAATGDVERAVFLFERAEGIEKYEAEARLRHAQALVRAGRYADALPLLKRSLEIRPRDDVQRYFEQVERVARARN